MSVLQVLNLSAEVIDQGGGISIQSGCNFPIHIRGQRHLTMTKNATIVACG